MTGISSVQISGQPGAEDPDIYVRGTGSLSNEASKPLILVDGVERSFFQMDSHEIESVTVLKDASSTAVFGVRGANGVILVTTRRGTKGKPQISWNSTFGLTQSLRHLTGVDSYTYATLYSEAQRSDNPGIKDDQLTFSPFVTEMFRTKADPIMFPDVDWSKYIFKNVAWQTQHNATLSGGGDRIRYFVSLGYLDQDGMMKRFDESYDPNYNYQRFNYRSNIDVDITNTTQLKVNIGGRVSDKREPLTYSLWQNIMWCTPFASPGFVDGKYIYNYKNNYIPLTELTSGLDCYYNWGYRKTTQNELNLDLALSQNLDVITKGLTLNVKGAYNTSYYLATKRAPTGTNSSYTPIYLGTITQPGMDVSDPRFDNTIVYQTDGVTGMREPMTYGEDGSGKSRNWYIEASLGYQRTFGDHAVSALLLYNQSKTYYPGQYTDIPTAYVGYVGRLTYAYKNRYLVDFNAGYNGSENFAPKKRYGFFPGRFRGLDRLRGEFHEEPANRRLPEVEGLVRTGRERPSTAVPFPLPRRLVDGQPCRMAERLWQLSVRYGRKYDDAARCGRKYGRQLRGDVGKSTQAELWHRPQNVRCAPQPDGRLLFRTPLRHSFDPQYAAVDRRHRAAADQSRRG